MVKDFIVSEELTTKNGDLIIAESDQQHAETIINTMPGQFYQYPKIGVGIIRQLSGNINKIKLEKSIRKQLESDNYNVLKVDIINSSNGKLGIDLEAERKS